MLVLSRENLAFVKNYKVVEVERIPSLTPVLSRRGTHDGSIGDSVLKVLKLGVYVKLETAFRLDAVLELLL